jgi:hypothetical protein
MRLKVRTAALMAFLYLTAVVALGQQRIVVGTNVQVSLTKAEQEHNEVILAADPNDARRLLGGAMVFDPKKSNYDVVIYASFDRGRTWQPTLEVGTSTLAGDPATTFGPGGWAYSVSLSGGTTQQMTVHRSKDGGKTWLPPMILPFGDREYVTVDQTGGKYNGQVYIHCNSAGGLTMGIDGSRAAGIAIYRSTDRGETFSRFVLVPSSGHVSTHFGNGVILSDGTFVILFNERLPDRVADRQAGISRSDALLRVIRTEDGGNTFSSAVTISERFLPRRGYVNIPSLAVDPGTGPFRDRLYAVWTDDRSGRNEILFSYSANKGTTWSRPLVVNDDQPFGGGREGPDNFIPVVSVNRAGVVGVMWHDRRESPNNLDWQMRFAASLDGGDTFLPSVKVSEAPFTHDWNRPPAVQFYSLGGGNARESVRGGNLTITAVPSRSYFRGGDTAGLAADADGGFHPFWIDNRTGVPQVWTANVTVSGKAVRNGSPDLENLDDLTQKVTLEFSYPKYDPAGKTLSTQAHLVNTSTETLSGPIKIRVLTIRLGATEILNADNHEKGSGAVWDFTAQLSDNQLKPGERTRGKAIEFRVPASQVLDIRNQTFAVFELKVLGKVEKVTKP